MSAQQYLIDATTRHQVFLQRYAGGQAKQAKKTLNRLRREINARLSQEPTEFQSRRLNLVLADLDKLSGAAFGEIQGQVKQGAYDLATNEAEFSTELYNKTSSANFTMPSDAALIDAVDNRAMVPLRGGGVDINSALSEFSTKKTEQIYQTIRDGIALGDTTPAISSKIGGVMRNLQARQLESLVRTATNHASSVARAATYEQNTDLLEGYEWVSTLDSSTTLICMSRDGQVFEQGVGPMPPAHWNCVLPGTKITSADGISAVFKRVFEGKIVTIETVSGNKLSVTPNHPILTSKGWTPAKLLNVGDDCVNQVSCKGVGSVDSNDDSAFHSVEDVFESFGRSSGVFTSEVKIAAPDFHGDGADNEVAQVRAASYLSGVFDAGLIEKGGDSVFGFRNVPLVDLSGHVAGLEAFLSKCPFPPFGGGVGLSDKLPLYGGAGSIHSGLLLSGAASEGDAILKENSLDGTWTDAESVRDTPDSYAGGVFFEDIVSVDISEFSGHVYNLETVDHCFAANGIITHNCRSSTIPKVKREFSQARGLTGKRAARGAGGPGEVGANVTYGGWLKRQPKEFVDEALGVERSQLFRSGKLKIDQFVDPTGRVYTIDELKRMNPFVFQEQ